MADKCVICGRAIRRTGSNWIMTPNGMAHKKCPKDKLSPEEHEQYESLKNRLSYHLANNAKGYIAENGMNFMRALQIIKQLHDKGYSYSEIEFALDSTVKSLNGFWGMKQVTNRIEPIIAKKRLTEQKMSRLKDVRPVEQPKEFDLSKFMDEEDDW